METIDITHVLCNDPRCGSCFQHEATPNHSERLERPMAKKPLPSQDEINQLLRYSPEDGKLFWKERSSSIFKTTPKVTAERRARMWNLQFSGTEAFTCNYASGYKRGTFMGVDYLAHRIIWKMVTGEDPDQVDHINGVKSDNRISNLRNVSPQENARNQHTPRNNTSGRIGVCWNAGSAKWQASISVQGRLRHLGLFQSLDEAVAARSAAEVGHQYHENHGRK